MTFHRFHRPLAAATELLAPDWMTAKCLAEATFLPFSGVAYCVPAKDVLILCPLTATAHFKVPLVLFFLQLTYSIILVSEVQHGGQRFIHLMK